MNERLVLVLCLILPFSTCQDSTCNLFQKYVLFKDECPSEETNEVEQKSSCSYFQKYVLWRKECNEVPQVNTTFTKCNRIQQKLLGQEYCNYIPDQYLDVPQIIARHGYPSETHIVVTEDGYLLQVHRIPRPKLGASIGQPIFLQHGLLGSSADWIINGNNTLAFLLADKGYDVWLGNARGNVYSRSHISLPNDHSAFWNFSFHEMGTKDLPSVITYITRVTKKPGELIYVGHSMGTTMFYVFASENVRVAKNVKVMVGMGSAAYMTHITSPIRYFAPLSNDLEWLRKYLGFNQFLPNNKLMRALSFQCELFKIDSKMCENLIFAICGFNKEEFNTKILPILLAKDPAGASTKTIIHYAQEIRNNGNFQKYDYGEVGNMIEYGTKTPPLYNITSIRTPIYLMYAMNDWLSNPEDVFRFASGLKNLAGLYKIKMDSFNHVDYIFGKDAETLVYQPLIKFLSNYTESFYDSFAVINHRGS
ncbi:unnamed protein product [Diabrotica balteata]|uniref:Partial AB-hydrolase lipase domain-containing protein n=1 Tax=Diabrotica balteata TaxID=107213 RepID=A0A9N9XGB4_DIABA|nr:unnamed protein product [Diabrotica balteata]